MPEEITYCVPVNKICFNLDCQKHCQKAPIDTVVNWADFYDTCSDKKEEGEPINMELIDKIIKEKTDGYTK